MQNMNKMSFTHFQTRFEQNQSTQSSQPLSKSTAFLTSPSDKSSKAKPLTDDQKRANHVLKLLTQKPWLASLPLKQMKLEVLVLKYPLLTPDQEKEIKDSAD